MGKSNRQARRRLARLYGEGCFIEKMGIRFVDKHDEAGRRITFHHLIERSKGGQSTVENGANLAWANHLWLHSLPPSLREELNNRIRQWKYEYLILVEHCDKVKVEKDLRLKHQDFGRLACEDENFDRKPRQRKEVYNRAKEKQQLRKMLEEYYDDWGWLLHREGYKSSLFCPRSCRCNTRV